MFMDGFTDGHTDSQAHRYIPRTYRSGIKRTDKMTQYADAKEYAEIGHHFCNIFPVGRVGEMCSPHLHPG